MPNKDLGQHWLRDEPSLKAVCDAAELDSEDVVLEIGPGLGTLTKHLLSRVKKVIAIELDHKLAARLANSKITRSDLADDYNRGEITRSDLAQGPTLQTSQEDIGLIVVAGDVLDFDLTQLPKSYKVVANIPYYLTSKLLRMLLGADNQPSSITLLVQKEVAERITAKPGDMSVLSFSVQYYGQVELGSVVRKELFQPPPKVDSQIIKIKLYDKPVFAADHRELFRLVKAGFGERRKKLVNSLAGGLKQDKEVISQWLEKADIPPSARAQELSMKQWEKLYNLVVSSKHEQQVSGI